MNKRRLRLQYILSDIITSVLIWSLFMIFRKIVNNGMLLKGILQAFPDYNFFATQTIFLGLSLFIHYLTGFYNQPQKHQPLNTTLTTISSSIIITLSIFFTLLLNDTLNSYLDFYYSIEVLLGLNLLFTLSGRLYVDSIVKKNYRTKRWTVNTLIIGSGAHARKIAEDFSRNDTRNTVIGFVAIDHTNHSNNARVLGHFAEIDSLFQTHQIDEAVIVLDEENEQLLFKIIHKLYHFNIDIHFSARLYEILTGSARIGKIGMNPYVTITEPHMSDWESSIKRVADLCFSVASLIILSPLILYFAIRIKMDSKGPVFYLQQRIGRYGKPFNIIKFRSMYTTAENSGPQLSNACDTRITKIGRILRKYRIDEIPQFWNIIKGEMSLVGPRPERRFFINQITEQAPYYCLLYKIRPGLTSWGPIKIGYTDSLKKMIERLNYDIIYLENMSLFNDLRIILSTIEILLRGKGV